MRFASLPSYSTLLRSYPDKHSIPTKTLLDSIGGQVRMQLDGPYSQFGAFGHVDLFRLWPNADKPPRLEPACIGECHWWTIGGPMTAYLWETTR